MSRRREDNEPQWLNGGNRDDAGNLISNLRNAMLALHGDPQVSTCFALDEMSRHVMVVNELPLALDRRNSTDESLPRPLADTDATRIQSCLQSRGLPRISVATIRQAIEERAERCKFHPVRDWLDSLMWDGTQRAHELATRYFGATASDHLEVAYLDAISEMFMVAMVARIYRPGCKADYCVVLEGEQGSYKSTACRILAGDAHFSDSLPDLRQSKEASSHLRGKWLIEIAELHAIKGASSEMLKAFLSRTEEQFRPAYGHAEVTEARQCLFIGTTNKTAYLHDETGGRRFWPIKTGFIDLAALARDRDQLFAEAVAMFNDGMQWWPDAAFEAEHIKPVQAARFDADPWQEAIAQFLAGKRIATVKEIAIGALEIPPDRIDKATSNRVAAALQQLGWRRSDKLRDGIRPWVNPIASQPPALRAVA